MEDIRVAIQAPDPITRIGLVGALRMSSKVRVVGHDHRAEAQVLVFATDRLHLAAATRLRQNMARFAIPAVLVADDIEEEQLLTAVQCGVVAALLRSAVSVEVLTDYVVTAAKGGAVLSPDMLGGLFKHVYRLRRDLNEQRGVNGLGLTHREIEILRLLSDGYDTSEISEKLSYSERTIKNVLSGVLSRLGVRNRSHAVAYALRSGLL